MGTWTLWDMQDQVLLDSRKAADKDTPSSIPMEPYTSFTSLVHPLKSQPLKHPSIHPAIHAYVWVSISNCEYPDSPNIALLHAHLKSTVRNCFAVRFSANPLYHRIRYLSCIAFLLFLSLLPLPRLLAAPLAFVLRATPMTCGKISQ